MIEFIKGEKFCRWNGVLMSEENHKKLFGIDGEADISDDIISYDGVYYTDLPFGELVTRLAEWYGRIVHKVEDYDNVIDHGYGFQSWCSEKELENKMIIPIWAVENCTVRPMSDFKKDFPDFNQEKFLEFYNELDEYYEFGCK